MSRTLIPEPAAITATVIPTRIAITRQMREALENAGLLTERTELIEGVLLRKHGPVGPDGISERTSYLCRKQHPWPCLLRRKPRFW